MNHRHLGQSGLVVSEISYGNWITHGSQVEKDAAIACVRAALEVGIIGDPLPLRWLKIAPRNPPAI